MSPRLHYAQATGFAGTLMVTSRLDSCTQGVVLLGKSRTSVVAFNRLMRRDGALSKTYCALSEVAPPLGAHTGSRVCRRPRPSS